MSPRENVTEIGDAAARSLRRTPPANTSLMQLRPNTSAQRKTKLLLASFLPDIVKSFLSPDRKTRKQADAKKTKTPTQQPKPHHQK